MNQNHVDFLLMNVLRSSEGWGRAAAGTISKTVEHRIGAMPHGRVFRISLGGMRRMDVTFASEAIMSPVKAYLGLRHVCLTDPGDPDLTENIAAAAERAKTPLTLWIGTRPEIIGLTPSVGLREALAFVLERGEVRSAELASAQRISTANAGNKLKQLSEAGFLMRISGIAPSGGPEFVYRPIG